MELFMKVDLRENLLIKFRARAHDVKLFMHYHCFV